MHQRERRGTGTALNVVDTTPDDHGLTGHSVDIALKGVGQTTGAQHVSVGTNTVTDIEPDNGALVDSSRGLCVVTSCDLPPRARIASSAR
jgi:hypothetical protein